MVYLILGVGTMPKPELVAVLNEIKASDDDPQLLVLFDNTEEQIRHAVCSDFIYDEVMPTWTDLVSEDVFALELDEDVQDVNQVLVLLAEEEDEQDATMVHCINRMWDYVEDVVRESGATTVAMNRQMYEIEPPPELKVKKSNRTPEPVEDEETSLPPEEEEPAVSESEVEAEVTGQSEVLVDLQNAVDDFRDEMQLAMDALDRRLSELGLT